MTPVIQTIAIPCLLMDAGTCSSLTASQALGMLPAQTMIPWILLVGIVAAGCLYLMIQRDPRQRDGPTGLSKTSEGKIHQLIQVINDGIALVDSAGTVDWCNGAFERLLELDRSEVIGQDLPSILQLSDSGSPLPRDAHPVITALRENTCITGCFQLIQSDKSVEISVQPILLDDEAGFALTARDLTDNLQYEQIILQSHALKAAAHAIVIADRNGLVQWANPAFTALTGYSLEEVHNKTLKILQSGQNGDELYRELWETILGGRVWSGKLINKRKDGSYYLEEQAITPVCDADGNIKHFIAIIQDVTEREETTKKLEEQEKSLRELLSVSADPRLEFGTKASKILKLASERLNMEVAVICQLDGSTLRTQNCIDPETQVTSNTAITPSDSLNRVPLDTQQPVLCTENNDNLRYHLSSFGEPGQFKAFLGSPITVDGVPAGTLSFATRLPLATEPGDSEKIFALLVSQWIGGEISKERMQQREMDIAAKIQSTLSAGQVERRLEGLDLAALSKASQNIDGDFFDVFEYGDRCTDIVIGDVMGKGVPAALLGAATKNNLLRVLSCMQTNSVVAGLPSPQEIMTSLHVLVAPRLLELEKFVTLVYARYTFSEKRFDFVDCGHMPILHFSAATQAWNEWKGENSPIGFLARENYMQKQILLDIDDILVLYSDGITEASSPSKQMYGPERLKRCIASHAEKPAKEIVSSIWESLLTFTQKEECQDDVTCIVLKVTNEHLGELLKKQSETVITSAGTFSYLRHRFSEFCEQISHPEVRRECQEEVMLAFHEAITNIYNHAHDAVYGKEIEYLFELFDFGLRISIIYKGKRFTGTMGTNVQNPELPGSGHGLTIISNAVDHSIYRYDDDGVNRTILTKYFEEEQTTCI